MTDNADGSAMRRTRSQTDASRFASTFEQASLRKLATSTQNQPAATSSTSVCNSSARIVPKNWDELPAACYSDGSAKVDGPDNARAATTSVSPRCATTAAPVTIDKFAQSDTGGVSSLWERPSVALCNQSVFDQFVSDGDFGGTAIENLARCGFGAIFRSILWPIMAGANTRGEVDLRAIVRARGVTRKDFSQICLDIFRTFPSIENNDINHLLALYQLLLATVAYNTDMGYAQSMNLVAGAIVLNVSEPSARFWVFDYLAHTILPYYWEPDWLGTRIDTRLLNYFIANRRPHLFRQLTKLDEHGILAHHIALSWFPRLFFSFMRPENVFWLWDLLFVHGPAVLFDFTLRILVVRADLISQVGDVGELFMHISEWIAELESLDDLLSVEFSKPIFSHEVNLRRAASAHAIRNNTEKLGEQSKKFTNGYRGCFCNLSPSSET